MSLSNGLISVDKITYDARNEADDLETQVENHKKKYGYYPAEVIADTKYGIKKIGHFCPANKSVPRISL